ncbi:MAG: PilZ domain-containing protein [Candidatus Omnitrophica bacterium]|nr:PilZ domain-containing protein [Candidatus Omnitrophota bacterium]
MQERRQAQRTVSSVFIRFKFEDQPEQKHEAFTQDISLEGVKIAAYSRLNLNDNLELNIDVPNNPDMTIAEGNVRWIGDKSIDAVTGKTTYLAGVEVTYMDKQDKEYLERFLKVHNPSLKV